MADKIVEPWTDSSAIYDNENLRVAMVDMNGSDEAGLSLLLLHSPRFDRRLRHCWVVRPRSEEGFYQIDFDARDIELGPNEQLTLTVPVQCCKNAESKESWSTLSVTLYLQYSDTIASLLK